MLVQGLSLGVRGKRHCKGCNALHWDWGVQFLAPPCKGCNALHWVWGVQGLAPGVREIRPCMCVRPCTRRKECKALFEGCKGYERCEGCKRCEGYERCKGFERYKGCKPPGETFTTWFNYSCNWTSGAAKGNALDPFLQNNHPFHKNFLFSKSTQFASCQIIGILSAWQAYLCHLIMLIWSLSEDICF